MKQVRFYGHGFVLLQAKPTWYGGLIRKVTVKLLYPFSHSYSTFKILNLSSAFAFRVSRERKRGRHTAIALQNCKHWGARVASEEPWHDCESGDAHPNCNIAVLQMN